MKGILALLAVLAFAAVPTQATLGVDVAYNYPLSSWSCLKNNGYQFAIIRCYQSLGHVDANCASSVEKAWNAGFKNVDLYVFPCPKCGNATGQIQSLYDYVVAQNINYGLIWLDIEGSQYWLGDTTSNRAFYTELYAASEKLFGTKFGGTYANYNGWSEILGDWNGGAARQLWWPSWDSAGPSFSSFTPFCGWSKANIKQYKGDQTVCSMDVDLNYY